MQGTSGIPANRNGDDTDSGGFDAQLRATPWMNVVHAADDAEIAWIDDLEQRARFRAIYDSLGALTPVPAAEFEGCGSCGGEQRRIAETCVGELAAWLQGQPSALTTRLGERGPIKEWLVASLAKTLKQHAAIPTPLRPEPPRSV